MPWFHSTKVVWAPTTLQQHTTGATTATTMAAANGDSPKVPHMSPCAPHQCVKWMGGNPSSKGI
jgi:hypothetical protein